MIKGQTTRKGEASAKNQRGQGASSDKIERICRQAASYYFKHQRRRSIEEVQRFMD